MGGHRDDRDMRAGLLFELSNGLRGFQPVHFRHLHIHQDEIERGRLPELHGCAPGFRHRHLVTLPREYADGQFLIGEIVFRQQDLQRADADCRGMHAVVADGDAHHLDTQRRHDGIEQFRLFQRLHQPGGNSQLLAPVTVTFAAPRGEHDDQRRIQRRFGANPLGQCEAADIGHVDVGQHQPDRLPA